MAPWQLEKFCIKSWSQWAFWACALYFRPLINYPACETHAQKKRDTPATMTPKIVLQVLWTLGKNLCTLLDTWSRTVRFIWPKRNTAFAKWLRLSSSSACGIKLHPFPVIPCIHTGVAWIHVDLGVYPVVTDNSPCFSGRDGRIESHLDSRTWHVMQLVPPTSEPFKPTVLCLQQDFCAHPPGTPVEPGFTPSLAACWNSYSVVFQGVGSCRGCFVFFFLLALVPIEKTGKGESWVGGCFFMLIDFLYPTSYYKTGSNFYCMWDFFKKSNLGIYGFALKATLLCLSKWCQCNELDQQITFL